MVRARGERPVIGGECLLVAAHAGERGSTPGERIGHVRFDHQRLIETDERRRQLAKLEMDRAEQEQGIDVARIG